MEIRAVLFDLDNTLFDHPASVRTGVRLFLEHVGVGCSQELTSAWFRIEQANYDRYLAKELSFEEQRRERLREFRHLAGSDVPPTNWELDELFAKYVQSYEEAWTAFPDAVSTLRSIRAIGLPVGVVTNGNHKQQTAKISRTGLEGLLDGIFSSELMNHAKPEPEAFTLPCQSLNVLPSGTLYVGDNYRVDVEGARNAGLQALHLDRDGFKRKGTIQSFRGTTVATRRNHAV
ncbi:HAD family hydrolase [Arthrobacter sp. FW306-06-A]|uniref:HAD family hydrolase n=1 Tax=Arthrobacter sp. FW306-06-A TaxID=2879621 RepID=UPI001F31FAA3|nr:HAD family hydrolase [Arthrobacter sp. FW306-06-A]UKA73059.1 HAD family hydrolase [Arthrobacter sp. FW306-06-A]